MDEPRMNVDVADEIDLRIGYKSYV